MLFQKIQVTLYFKNVLGNCYEIIILFNKLKNEKFIVDLNSGQKWQFKGLNI